MTRPARWDLLPRVARAEVRVIGQLAAWLHHDPRAVRAGEQVLARCGGATIDVEAPYAFARSELAGRLAHSPWIAVRVRLAGGRAAAVVIDGGFAGRLAAGLLGLGADELPGARSATLAEQGVIAALVAMWLDARAVGGALVDGTTADVAALGALLADAWVVGVDVRVHAGGRAGVVRVLLPESLLGAAPPPRPDTGRVDGLPLRVAVIAGGAWLSAADVDGLGCGDVVPLPGATRGAVWLRAGRGGLHARLAADGLTIVDPYRPGESMPEATNDALARDLTVPVSCRLAQLEMTVAELAALAPGAVLPLGRALGGTVELCAGERVLARGELVDVEGELGVRITEVVR